MWLRIFTLTLLFSFSIGNSICQDSTQLQRQEEMEDYYKKWLNEDAVYIITDEERAVFERLSTPEEKEQFIEQFWFRRDPNPRTAHNEFKDEHYRRIAYANEHFKSGREGWRSDRGRIYIIHGPPAEISTFPTGGMYERPLREGGGVTTTYPFEVWRYRSIEGLGDNITLEFVDPSLTGEYRLALYPEEKDALLNVPHAGPTLAEKLGLATKADRPWFKPTNRETYPAMALTARDNPFYRYEQFSMIKAPTTIKYNDLKELIRVNISYTNLPFETTPMYFRLNQEQVIAPVNVQISNQELTFKPESGRSAARVNVYGIVTSITNRVVAEFEDDLVMTFTPEQLKKGLTTESVYQKVLVLDQKQKYKLDLVIRDQESEKLGTVRKAIMPPSYNTTSLASSSVIFSQSVRVLDVVPEQNEMFVLGDVKILPNLSHRFRIDTPVGLYFQLYNVEFDQATQKPSLKMVFQIYQKGEKLREAIDTEGESIQFLSDERIVVIERLDVDGLAPGEYEVKVDIEDQLSGKSLTLEESFEVIG